MKNSALVGACLLCLGLSGSSLLRAQAGPAYRPAPPLRIDLEGKHRIVDRTAAPLPEYKAGVPLRIDLEGKHRVVDRTPAPAPEYRAGPPLRVDLEGKHRIKKNQ